MVLFVLLDEPDNSRRAAQEWSLAPWHVHVTAAQPHGVFVGVLGHQDEGSGVNVLQRRSLSGQVSWYHWQISRALVSMSTIPSRREIANSSVAAWHTVPHTPLASKCFEMASASLCPVRGYLTQRCIQRSSARGAPECDRNVVMCASELYSCCRIGVQRIAAGLVLGLRTCASVSHSDGERLRSRESRICPRVSFTWHAPFLTNEVLLP